MMVTSHSSKSFPAKARNIMTKWVKDFGRNDITKVRYTETVNQMGGIGAQTSATETIRGDLQFVTIEDHKILLSGIARLGDGILYAETSVDLQNDDEITVDTVTWKLVKQVEGETVEGLRIYQAWVCVRRN